MTEAPANERKGAALLRYATDTRAWHLLHANGALCARFGSGVPCNEQALTEAWPDQAMSLAAGAEAVLRLGVDRDWFLAGDHNARFRLIPWSATDVLLVEESLEGLLLSAAEYDIAQRKEEQEAMRMSAERLRRIMDTTYDAFVAMDEKGCITAWNTKAEQMFGLPRTEAIGRELASTIIPPAQQQAHRKGLAHFLATGQGPVLNKRLELYAERRDGTLFPIELTITALKHGDTHEFNAFIADISERKQAEALFRDLLEAAPDAMVIVDRQGLILLVNAQTEKLFGKPRSKLVGQNVEVLVPQRYRAAHAGHRSGFFDRPHTRMMGNGLELHGLHGDGHEFPVEISLSPLETPEGPLVSAAIRDITARKRGEMEIRELNRTLEQRVNERTAALLQSEERFHEALDGMMEGVQVIDHEWRYSYVNEAVVRQSTYTREQLLGRTMMELYPGIEGSEMFAMLRQCRKDGEPRVLENAFRFPNGAEGVFELSIRPTHDSLFILSTDITARKHAEWEVLAQSERLKRQNAELEQFAYIASHDLQEPLRMVASYVELLERRYGDKLDQDAKEFIGFAVDGTRRMKQLIQDLLFFSRVGRPTELQNVTLEQVLADVKHDLQRRITESGARITHGPLPVVRGVRTSLFQLLQNLISNAIKFQRPGVPPEVHIEATDTGTHWSITVQDNGIGIDMAYAEQVFMPFKRLHPTATYPGTGIGLAVAKKVVEGLGGRIHLTSVLGQGTTFTFTLSKSGTHATHRDPSGGG